MLDIETGRRIFVYFVLGLCGELQKGSVGSAWKCSEMHLLQEERVGPVMPTGKEMTSYY